MLYRTKEEKVVFLGSCAELSIADEPTDLNMSRSKGSSGGADGYISEDDAVALLKDDDDEGAHPCSCFRLCTSYRSPDHDFKVTPFAVILLLILFVIYILNQADRLMLPVAIPSGLRCEVSIKSECRNSTDDPNNSSNLDNTTDCIHFSDNEQGLLTGACTTMPLNLAYFGRFQLMSVLHGIKLLILHLLNWGCIFISPTDTFNTN